MHDWLKVCKLYREGSGVVHCHGLPVLGEVLAIAFLRYNRQITRSKVKSSAVATIAKGYLGSLEGHAHRCDGSCDVGSSGDCGRKD